MYALDAATGAIAWQARLAGDVSQFAVAGNTVYVATSARIIGAATANTSGQASITALDLHSGAQRWQVVLTASFLTASLRATSSAVFAGSMGGKVWAFRADTGATAWRYAMSPTNQVPGPAQLATPTQGLLVLTGAGNQIVALDTSTGKVRWRYAVQGEVPAPAAIAGHTLYAGSWDSVLYALDAHSGALTWRSRFPSAIYTTPFVLQNTVYVSGVDGDLYAVSVTTGAIGWHYHAGATYTVPAAETPEDMPVDLAIKGRYFATTGHDLSGAFLAFWDRYGGMPIFGYPITEPYSQNGQTVQFTERFGLVLKNGVVSTLPLGSAYTTGRTVPQSAPPVGSTGKYFASTGQSLSGRFLAYWQAHHGDRLLGAPISGVVYEGNGDGSGHRYQMQWFQRGRLEYHPENGHTPYEMQIGLLGTQTLQAWGWLSSGG
jgi:outer membrane protein assembly factor BamB